MDLAEFLRARRAALTPEQVGLVPGPRRRTPGLRREEVAMLAGVSVSWYTWLEQGRPINVSDDVLDSLARVLQLDSVECRYLAELAGHHDHVADAHPVKVPDWGPRMLAALDPAPGLPDGPDLGLPGVERRHGPPLPAARPRWRPRIATSCGSCSPCPRPAS